MSSHGTLGLLALLLLVGCPSGGDLPGGGGRLAHIDEDARALRYPPERLPWKAHPGAQVALGLVRENPLTDRDEPIRQPMAAVVALPGRVVVVFPPADHPGLDLAWAGLDVPWQRTSLLSTPLESIGALDAVADEEGRVHVFVRERDAPGRLRYLRWREGEPVTEEPMPEVPRALGLAAYDRCPDVSAATQSSGRLAVAWTVRPEPTVSTVQLARRGEDGVWRVEQIASSAYLPAQRAFREAGCRTLVRVDERGYLLWATLFRTVPTALSANEPLRYSLPRLTVSSAETFDGRFELVGSVRDEALGSEYGGLFDLHADGLGVLWASPYYFKSFPFAGAAVSLSEGFVIDKVDVRDPGAAFGGKLYVDECRNHTVFREATLTRAYPTRSGTACPQQSRAPVLSRGTKLTEPVLAVWTRATRPYFVGLCIDGDSTVALCGPLYDAPTDHEGRVCAPTPDEFLPVLTPECLPDGSTEVPPAGPIIFAAHSTASTWAEVYWGWHATNLDTLRRVSENQTDATPGRWPLKEPLTAGHRYWAGLSNNQKDWGEVSSNVRDGCVYPWQYALAGLAPPRLSFQMEGRTAPKDPRETPWEVDCVPGLYTRAADGVCELSVPAEQAGDARELSLFSTVPLRGGPGTGGVEAGGVPIDGVTWKLNSEKNIQYTLPGPLTPGTTYTVRMPEQVRSIWGRPRPSPETRGMLRITVDPPGGPLLPIPIRKVGEDIPSPSGRGSG
ncbi:hypothetical protein KYC5002_10350 [Archangium violaceum]|uniref:hypothetical protein n=1 Tax=Archangium violaceum TaxID=83451 RepID=UPI002B2E5C70|nr:hypothetical protein KYC5002_10350 [Archangium gephyra]